MSDPIVEARIRARRYWYRDGLSEILVGAIILLQNGLTLVMHFGNRNSSWYMLIVLIYLLLFLAFALCACRIMAAAREHITYPRIGYVHESGRKRRRLVWMVLALLAAVTVTLALRYASRACCWDPARWNQGMPVVVGLVFGVVGIYVAVRYGVLRYLLIGLFSIALGLAINIEYPTWLGGEIWIVAVGCAFLCAGGVTVSKFVRTTPLSADAK
jgi:hypothetical protein